MAILWLSFLTAGAASAVFFSFIDPMDLRTCLELPDLGATAYYSIGFLLFWLLTATSSILTAYFVYPRRTRAELHLQPPTDG
jgi:cytosine/uracil/thiamine/allantoin permease